LDLETVTRLAGLLRPLRHVRKFIQVRREEQVRAADANFVLRAQPMLAAKRLAVEVSAVQAAEVANGPAQVVRVKLRMFPAAQIVAKDDAVGWRPAEIVARAGLERIHVPVAVFTANDEECARRSGHETGRRYE